MRFRRFRDRSDAGRQLAERVSGLGVVDPVVLALPRGGVPVGYEVAKALGDGTPLDVFVARKVGAPGNPELGIGAIAEGGGSVVNQRALDALGLTTADFDSLAEAERPELERRVLAYRGDRSLPPLAGRDVVLVDDGLATGVTAEAALRSLRAQARRVVLAVPVCPPTAPDHVVAVMRPPDFYAVGQWYEDFTQTTDEEVRVILEELAVG